MSNAFSLDERAKGLAKDFLRAEGELLSVLVEMRRRRVFAELNYSGIFDYCERALGLSRAQAFYFKTVAEKSEVVPEIRVAVAQGVLSLSQARRIVPVINRENSRVWIEKAKSLSQKELEREVTAVNPKAHVQERIRPVAQEVSELKVPVDRQTEENLAVLREVLSQKLGKAASLSDVIAWAAETAREKFDPIRRARRARVISSGNAAKPGRHPVPASVKHQVVLRDEMQCTHVGSDGRRCGQRRWLQLHHLLEVSRGGVNAVGNLRSLCHAHHQLAHSRAG